MMPHGAAAQMLGFPSLPAAPMAAADPPRQRSKTAASRERKLQRLNKQQQHQQQGSPMQFGIPMSLPISAPHLQQAVQSQPADPSRQGFVVALEQGSTPSPLQQPALAQPTVLVRVLPRVSLRHRAQHC